MTTDYRDHDPSIVVRETGESQRFCLEVTLGSVTVLLHVRSAVDLSQKLNKACLDWIARRAHDAIKD